MLQINPWLKIGEACNYKYIKIWLNFKSFFVNLPISGSKLGPGSREKQPDMGPNTLFIFTYEYHYLMCWPIYLL